MFAVYYTSYFISTVDNTDASCTVHRSVYMAHVCTWHNAWPYASSWLPNPQATDVGVNMVIRISAPAAESVGHYKGCWSWSIAAWRIMMADQGSPVTTSIWALYLYGGLDCEESMHDCARTQPAYQRSQGARHATTACGPPSSTPLLSSWGSSVSSAHHNRCATAPPTIPPLTPKRSPTTCPRAFVLSQSTHGWRTAKQVVSASLLVGE
jgi:hypothetical protein